MNNDFSLIGNKTFNKKYVESSFIPKNPEPVREFTIDFSPLENGTEKPKSDPDEGVYKRLSRQFSGILSQVGRMALTEGMNFVECSYDDVIEQSKALINETQPEKNLELALKCESLAKLSVEFYQRYKEEIDELLKSKLKQRQEKLPIYNPVSWVDTDTALGKNLDKHSRLIEETIKANVMQIMSRLINTSYLYCNREKKEDLFKQNPLAAIALMLCDEFDGIENIAGKTEKEKVEFFNLLSKKLLKCFFPDGENDLLIPKFYLSKWSQNEAWKDLEKEFPIILRQLYIELYVVPFSKQGELEKEFVQLLDCKGDKPLVEFPSYIAIQLVKGFAKSDFFKDIPALDWLVKGMDSLLKESDPKLQKAGRILERLIEITAMTLTTKVGTLVIDPKNTDSDSFLLSFLDGAFLKLKTFVEAKDNSLTKEVWTEFLKKFLSYALLKEAELDHVEPSKEARTPVGLESIKESMPKVLGNLGGKAKKHSQDLLKQLTILESLKEGERKALEQFTGGKELSELYQSGLFIRTFRHRLKYDATLVKKYLPPFLREYAPFLTKDNDTFKWVVDNVKAVLADQKSEAVNAMWKTLENNLDLGLFKAIKTLRKNSDNKTEFKLLPTLMLKLYQNHKDLFNVSKEELKEIKRLIKYKNILLNSKDVVEKQKIQKEFDKFSNILLIKFQTVVKDLFKQVGLGDSDEVPMAAFVRSLIGFDDKKWAFLKDNVIAKLLYIHFAEIAIPLLEENENQKALQLMPNGDSLDKQSISIANALCDQARRFVKYEQIAVWLAGKMAGPRASTDFKNELAQHLEDLMKNQDDDVIWTELLPRYVRANLIQVFAAVGEKIQSNIENEPIPLLEVLIDKMHQAWDKASLQKEDKKQYAVLVDELLTFIGWGVDGSAPLPPFFMSFLKRYAPDIIDDQFSTVKAVWNAREENRIILRTYKNGENVERICKKVLDKVFSMLKRSVVDVSTIANEIVNMHPNPTQIDAKGMIKEIERMLSHRGVTITELISALEKQNGKMPPEFIKKLKESTIKERLNNSLITIRELTAIIRDFSGIILPKHKLNDDQALSLAKQIQQLLIKQDPFIWDFIRGQLDATIMALAVKAAKTHIKDEEKEDRDLFVTLGYQLFCIVDSHLVLPPEERESKMASRLLVDLFGISKPEDMPSIPRILQEFFSKQVSKVVSKRIVEVNNYHQSPQKMRRVKEAKQKATTLLRNAPIMKLLEKASHRFIENKVTGLSEDGALPLFIQSLFPEDSKEVIDSFGHLATEMLNYDRDETGFLATMWDFKKGDPDHNLDQLKNKGAVFGSELIVDVVSRLLEKLSQLSRSDRIELIDRLMNTALQVINRIEQSDDNNSDKEGLDVDKYDDLIKKIMDIGYPNGHEDLIGVPPQYRLFVWKQLNRKILPKVVPSIIKRLFDIQTIRKIMIKVAENVDEALIRSINSEGVQEDEEISLDVKRSPEEEKVEKEFKKTVGKVTIAAIKLLKLPLTGLFIRASNQEERERIIGKHAGEAIIKKLDEKDHLLKVIERVVKFNTPEDGKIRKKRLDIYAEQVAPEDVKESFKDPAYNLVVAIITDLWKQLHDHLEKLINLLLCGYGKKVSDLLRNISSFIIFKIFGTLAHVFIWSWLRYLVQYPLHHIENVVENKIGAYFNEPKNRLNVAISGVEAVAPTFT